MKYQKEPDLSVGLSRHSLATNLFLQAIKLSQATQIGWLEVVQRFIKYPYYQQYILSQMKNIELNSQK